LLSELSTVLRAAVYSGATSGIFSVLQSAGKATVSATGGTVMGSASAIGGSITSLFSSGTQAEVDGRENVGHPPPDSSREPGPPEHVMPTRRQTLNDRLLAASRSQKRAVVVDEK